MKDLTKGNPLKLILIFAIPLFIGQIFQLFYSLVDIRIIGSTIGEAALAAVGATTSLSDLLVGLLNGMTNGFGIIIAMYFGAKDEVRMKNSIGWTIVLSIVITLMISGGCILFLPQILDWLNISNDLVLESKGYIQIILAGLIATTLYNTCAAILRSIGDSFTPLMFLIISSVLNVFLDYMFILNFNLGVQGAAFATVISQIVSAVLCFLYMKRKYPQLKLSFADFNFNKEVIAKLLSSGFSMSFMISFVHIGTVALQTSINTFGSNIIIAHAAARKITSIFMMSFSVFGATLATYCGQNLGAKEYMRIKKGIKDTVLFTFGWCVGVMILAYTISPVLVKLITATDTPEIINTASFYLKVNTTFYFVPAVICLFRNSMQGFGDTKTPVFSSLLELIGKVLIAYFLAPAIGYMGIIVAEPIVWFIMVIPLIVNMARNPIFKNIEENFSQKAV